MKRFWPSKGYDFYKRAALFWNYPEVPFGPYIRALVRPADTVADIGCGFGITSIYLAGLCRKVFAIDQDPRAIDQTQKDAATLGIDNIETICAVWPEFDLEPCDITLGLYHYHFAHSAEKIKKLITVTKRAGLISCQAPMERESFHSDLMKLLGLDSEGKDWVSCENGCYVRGRLEQAGLVVECARVSHDFGQPVEGLDEAAIFLCGQLKLDDSHLPEVAKHADKYIIQMGDKLIIPIKRYNCLLTFRK